MSDFQDRKVFEDLNFQVWRVKDLHNDKWRDEIYIMGDDAALQTLSHSLKSLLGLFQTYGKGTKKYKCNPPTDLDIKAFGEDNGIQIQWLDMLIVRMGFDALDNEQFILNDFMVELSVNPTTLKQFIDKTDAYLNSDQQFAHGADAVCGLRFSPDWVGAE